MALIPPNPPIGNHVPAVRVMSEKKLGILHYVSPMDSGWRGDIRKRYVVAIYHCPSVHTAG